MSPARSSTRRCFEIAGWLSSNGAAKSFTDASPLARRARMARLVGSARAANVTLSGSGCCLSIAPELYNHVELYHRAHGCQGLRRYPRGRRMKLHLVDATFELFRAYYSRPPRRAPD